MKVIGEAGNDNHMELRYNHMVLRYKVYGGLNLKIKNHDTFAMEIRATYQYDEKKKIMLYLFILLFLLISFIFYFIITN